MEIAFVVEGKQEGSFVLDANYVRIFSQLAPAQIAVHGGNSADHSRSEAEQFIEKIYAQSYGSVIKGHYPVLMSLRDATDCVVAAVGIRQANDEALFLEQYLSGPIETVLSSAVQTEVHRHEIAEIGNLASNAKGGLILLFLGLAAYLKRRQCAYAAVTATNDLRRAFETLGFEARSLCRAQASALPDRGISWGRYYETEPEILFGSVSGCFSRLKNVVKARHVPEEPLFPKMPGAQLVA